MNKKNLAVLLTISASLLSSCNNNDFSCVATIFGDKSLKECIDIDYSTFSSMMDDKMNFVIAQYPENHCYCWSYFRDNILYPYVEETHLQIYQIGYTDFSVPDRNHYGIDVRSDRPSVYVIENGNVKFKTMYSSDNELFHDYNAFKGWMKEFVYMPKIFYIKEEELENLFSGTKNFMIYYSWSVCPDCSFLQRNHLEDYYKNIQNDYPEIYIIDCYTKGIMLNENGEYDRPLYDQFLAKYNLTASSNSKFGYRTGVVPTIQYVEPNGTFNPNESIKSSFVYVNDVITYENEQYIVSESFFSRDRLPYLEYLNNDSKKIIEGKILSESEIEANADKTKIKWKYEKSAEIYNPLFDAFMNFYKDKIK